MTRPRKSALWIVLAFSAGILCSGPIAVAEETPTLPGGMRAGDEDGDEGMDQKMLTFNFSEYTQDGKKKMEIEGESADIYSSSVDLYNITAHIHSTDQAITITSDTGTFDRNTTNVQLISNVVAQSEDGSRVVTDSFNYDSGTGVGTTDDFTVITREDMISTGTGAVVYSKGRRAQLNKDVRVQFPSGDGPDKVPTVITCNGLLEADYEKGVAVFHDDVLVEDERGTVKSDVMEVYMEREEKAIGKIVCTGNVHIQQGGNQSFSDGAVYLAKQGQVVLTGSPRLILYPDDMEKANALIGNTGTGQDL